MGAIRMFIVKLTIGTHDLLGAALVAEWLVSASAVVRHHVAVAAREE